MSQRKPTSSRAALFVLFGVLGCGKPAERVYVDLTAVSLSTSPVVEVSDGVARGQAIRTDVALPELGQRDLFIGSEEDRAKKALEVYSKTQESAVAGVVDRLEKLYMAEVSAAQREEAQRIQDAYHVRAQEELDRLRADFEAHAETVGELRAKLAAIVGFPDPDPKSLRVPPSHDKSASAKFQDAKGLREQIIAQDTKFRDLAATRMKSLEDERAQMLARLEYQTQEQRSRAVERAREESKSVAQQSLSVLERTALSPETQLPAVAGVGSSVDSRPRAPQPIQPGTSVVESAKALKEQLDAFLRVHNYRLAKAKGRARDATQEFVAWRKKFTEGR